MKKFARFFFQSTLLMLALAIAPARAAELTTQDYIDIEALLEGEGKALRGADIDTSCPPARATATRMKASSGGVQLREFGVTTLR